MPSATDIVSISTGRETVLIGPRGAFGVDTSYNLLVRDPATIRAVLSALAMRPGLEQILRPYLHRWGIQPVAFRADQRAALTEAIARAAGNGSLGISIVPEVTLAFAGASMDQNTLQATPAPSKNGQLPPALIDRMAIVMEMVPQYLEGETRTALEDAIKGLGMGVVVGGIVSWIGAHFIPGIGFAVLAFDVFCLSRDTIEAIKRAAEVVDDVQKAKTRADLEPAAITFAGVVAALIVAGILNKLLKAKSLTKGVGKEGGVTEGKPAGRHGAGNNSLIQEGRKLRETKVARDEEELLSAGAKSGRVDSAEGVGPVATGQTLYRGDGRPPETIFNEGFKPRGTSEDLHSYVDTNKPSAFVGTSKSKDIATEFARSNSGHVYQVDASNLKGIDVNAAYSGNVYAREQEVAFLGGVPKESIICAQKVLPDGSKGPIIPNPFYKGPR